MEALCLRGTVPQKADNFFNQAIRVAKHSIYPRRGDIRDMDAGADHNPALQRSGNPPGNPARDHIITMTWKAELQHC